MNTPLVIIFITYERTKYALEAIDFACRNLKHNGQISWYVCDDGSKPEHYNAVLDALKERKQHICGHHSERLGYGGGVNKAWRVASQTSPVTLWLEDDWEIRSEIDLSPYIEILMERDNVGQVRLGHMPIGLNMSSVGRNGRMYMQIHKDKQYAYSGNPHLKHDRFMLTYGDFPTDKNPGQTELSYDWHVRNTDGPEMWWPLMIGDRFLFHHIGEEQSY